MATQARRERRGRPTQAEAAEKRQGIVDAATALFLSSGYREVSVRRIADAADVSTRTVFNLFEDKASLFIACLDSISPGVDSPLLTERPSVEETLEIFATRMLGTMSDAQGLGFARLVMTDGRDFPELAQAGFANQERQFVRPLAEFLSHRLSQPERSGRLARTFIAMAIAEWNRSVTFNQPLPGPEAVAEHAREVARIFVRGVDLID